MGENVKIGKRYTIVIPKSLREKLGIKENQMAEIEVDAGKLVITPKTADPFKKLSELMGDIKYDEKLERKVEKSLENISRTSNNKFL